MECSLERAQLVQYATEGPLMTFQVGACGKSRWELVRAGMKLILEAQVAQRERLTMSDLNEYGWLEQTSGDI